MRMLYQCQAHKPKVKFLYFVSLLIRTRYSTFDNLKGETVIRTHTHIYIYIYNRKVLCIIPE